jgi:PD-(D/E)XK nuclease superfamily protein
MGPLRIPTPLPDDLEELVQRIIGACIVVHQALGPGLLEGIYTRAVAAELSSLGIKCEIHVAQVISYLKVTRARIGLLMNFNAEYLRSGLRRVIL